MLRNGVSLGDDVVCLRWRRVAAAYVRILLDIWKEPVADGEGAIVDQSPGGLGLQDRPRPRWLGGSVLALSRVGFPLESHMGILILI